MEQDKSLAELGVYTSRAPRYTSYPTAAQFHDGLAAQDMADALAALDPARPVSVYVHIPFCERLCWFCACRTQGTQSHRPVQSYLQSLLTEIELVRAALPAGIRMGRLHWGGGTPTILKPSDMSRLADRLMSVFTPDETFEFSVEIDPTLVDQNKVDALSQAGMNRSSIGIQDFDPKVQMAIGRQQSFEQTTACVAMLRRAGIASLNADILYGLPYQTHETVGHTLKQVQTLDPDRIALYGYAHVPWMAKRQQMIAEAALPDGPLRRTLFAQMSAALEWSGYTPIGIDHFAKPGDSLAQAEASGHLRRNFQGYTTDRCNALIGLGASAISKFPECYTQNAPRSSVYQRIVNGHELATQRGVQLTMDDRLRARAIEMIMCDFSLDLEALKQEFGPIAKKLQPEIDKIITRFDPFVVADKGGISVRQNKRILARLIAQQFDAYTGDGARYSAVS